MVANRPAGPVVVPDVVVRRARGRACEAVWENELGGLTFRIGDAVAEEFVKWDPDKRGIDLSDEARRLTWAGAYTTVPRVLDVGEDESGQWLVTAPLPGENAVTERWSAQPVIAATAIGRGLRDLHDDMSIESCPFTWTAASRLANARRSRGLGVERPAAPQLDPVVVTDEMWAILDSTPSEDLVVCHGDACAPNTLIDDDGQCSGHVDMGRLGIGDRWADLAIAAWSTEWNYGVGYEDAVYAAYGVERDEEKIRYYRLLWNID